MKTFGLLLGVFLLCPVLLISQNIAEITTQDSVETRKIKHFSVAAKAGIPIGLGPSVEVVLPIFGNRLAPYLDYAKLSDLNVDDVSLNHNYLEYGANIYFGNQARGLYIGMGASSTEMEFAYQGEVSDNGNTFIGDATTTLDLDMFNVKLGLKTGGTLFFRIEVGYAMGDIPQELIITGTTEVMGVMVTETSTEPIPEVPGWSESGMIIGNISLGLSF